MQCPATAQQDPRWIHKSIHVKRACACVHLCGVEGLPTDVWQCWLGGSLRQLLGGGVLAVIVGGCLR